MYIYELPFEINKELCRLMDYDDDWKELAGVYMQYSAFQVNEIEQVAKRQANSPTKELFTRWGQQNHRVEELFMLLYRMKHVPAMRCLVSTVDNRFHRLLQKYDSKGYKDKHSLSSEGNNVNRQKTARLDSSDSSFPIPARNAELLPIYRESLRQGNTSVPSPTDVSDSSKNASSTLGKGEGLEAELLRNVSAIPMISYSDLQEATENWSVKNKLGKGGFGEVFKGEWKLLPIAVKRLNDNNMKSRELIGEMCLNKYRHDNILPLYGYSFGGPQACLVYQLMGGGSLEQRLKLESQPLTWLQRYRIAHGVARGLQYLHKMDKSNPLIHGDIKPANILLDTCTMPKIGDFGLARPGPYGEDRTHLKVSKVHGTRPYLPEEYVQSHNLSPSVDVFSYGVVMVEIATALKVFDRSRHKSLHRLSDYIHHLAREGVDFATLEDRNLMATQNSNPYFCQEFVSIGIHCTKYRGQERPTMLDVYRRLDAMEFPGKYLT